MTTQTKPAAKSRVFGPLAFCMLTLAAVAQLTTNPAPVEVEGTLQVLILDDFDNHRCETQHWLEETKSGKNFRLKFRGQPPRGALTGMRIRARGQAQGEEITLAADFAETNLTATSDFQMLASPLVRAKDVAALDTRTTLAIIVDFNDASVSCSKSSINSRLFSTSSSSMKGFYEQCSYGAITFSGKVVGPYKINYDFKSSCNPSSWGSAADSKARSGGDNPSDYDHVIYVLPSGGTCGWAGLGQLGGSRTWIEACSSLTVFAHEIGHNLGMYHASTDSDDNGSVNVEYGDWSDVMGNGGTFHPNLPHKRQKGWIPSSKVKSVSTSGTFEIAPVESDPASVTRLQGLRLDIDGSSQDYYFSYRRATGYDSGLGSTYAGKVSIHRWSGSGNTLFVKALSEGGSFDKLSSSGFKVRVVDITSSAATLEVQISGSAITRVWDDSGGYFWNNATRWSGDDIPNTTDENAEFSNDAGSGATATGVVNGQSYTLHRVGLNGISPTIKELHFYDNASGASGWLLNCGSGTSTLTVNGTPAIRTTYGSHLIAGAGGGTLNLRLGGTGANTIQVGSELQINATISGAASGSGLTKTGSGTLTLGGQNTFSGPFSMVGDDGSAAGVVVAAADYALGSGAATAKHNSDSVTAQLQLSGGITLGNSSLSTSGRGSGGTADGIVRSVSGSNSIPCRVNLVSGGGGSTYRADAGSTLAVSGTVGSTAGALTLTLSGGGNFIFSGAIQDDNTGGTPANTMTIVNNGPTTTLTGTNTFSGSTLVNAGALALAGSGFIANSPGITVAPGAKFDVRALPGGFILGASQTLTGGGMVLGNVTVNGTLVSGGSDGGLLFSNDLAIAGNVLLELNTTSWSSNNCMAVAGSLANPGTGRITVNLLGPALVAGRSFKLFSKAVANGGTMTITPAPGAGLAWSNMLAADGSIAVVAEPGLSSQALVPAGALWRYLDDGSSQGTAWRTAAFGDAGWKVGPAQLGYGDGDEATVVGFGPDAADKHITTWFRRAFTLANAAQINHLTASLLRDDGAVVYLNGTEVWRSNMPTNGTIGHTTTALASVGGDSESAWLTTNISPALLVSGTNILAVEIHQSDVDSSDISFDFALSATSLGNFANQPPDLFLAQPGDGQNFDAPATVTVTAFAQDPDGSVARVDFFVNGTKVGGQTAPPYTVTFPSLPIGDYALSAIAVDNQGVVVASLNAPVIHVTVPGTLIAAGSVWRYLDDGTDQGAAWRAPAFNDSAWKLGAAQLGYGEGDETTVIGYGPSATNKYITTWFRRSFQVADRSIIRTLTASLLRDDGAVVYLNGAEVWRSNMPANGAIAHTTPALDAVDEFTYFAADLDPALLVNGTNVIAVEIHQSSGDSSDVSFDLALTTTSYGALSNQPPDVLLTQPGNGQNMDAPATFTATAYAQDPDGSVARVEFYLNNGKISEQTAPPYSLTLSNLPIGDYTLRALAADNAGAVSASAISPTVHVSANVTMLTTGAVWRYLDDGSDQGAAWRAAAFDDSGWKLGRAQFGYGEGDEATVIGYGPSATNKYITTYFRTYFHLADAPRINNLTARLLRDDGAVVYLNGTEVWRSNLPTNGVITSTTRALTAAQENVWLTTNLNPALLVNGTNVLAVEIHQETNTSSDISFDFALTATNLQPGLLLAQPASGASFFQSSAINVAALAKDPAGTVAKVEFYLDGARIGASTNDPYSVTLSNLAVGDHVLRAVATHSTGATNISLNAPVIHILPPSVTTLLSAGTFWRYLDDGSDQGTAWRYANYDDAGWKAGPAQLGYGDGDEATVVGYGPSATNKYITTWFRRPFFVANAAMINGLTASLLRDDGAVVYLNGAEVWRSNMPTNGIITFTMLATNGITGTNETTWLTNNLNPALLVDGTNILAVEIHQDAVNSSDISFDFALTATSLGLLANQAPDLQLIQPSDGQLLANPGVVTLNAAVHDPDGTVAMVEFYAGATKVGERLAAPFSLTLSNLPIGDYLFTAIATDDDGARAASLNSPVAHVLASSPAPFIPAGAEWRYFDRTNDLGAAWRSNTFNDAAWSSGLTRLGFGGDGEATTIASNRQWTTYFRRAFYVPNPALIPALHARLTRDDAAVVYLNGAEIWRDTNITSGIITNQTPALSALGGTNETNWLTFSLPPSTLSLLQSGWNLLAAEVHQSALNSSDLGFDLELTGVQVVPVLPALVLGGSPGGLGLAWPASKGMFLLYSTTNLAAPAWTRATNEPVLSNGLWLVPLPAATNGSRFYRLQTR